MVRGLHGEGAQDILSKVLDANRYRFDQDCHVKSIELAKKLDMKACISINFLPNAVYSPEQCIRTTIAAAEKANFPLEKIIFEVTENEHVHGGRVDSNIVPCVLETARAGHAPRGRVD